MTAALKTADLSPEALAFVRGGAPKPAAGETVVQEVPATPAATPVKEAPDPSAPTEISLSKPKATPKREVSAPAPTSLVGLSFRLPAELHHATMRASFERKMQRQEPWTQQDIVAEALGAWLKKQGYL